MESEYFTIEEMRTDIDIPDEEVESDEISGGVSSVVSDALSGGVSNVASSIASDASSSVVSSATTSVASSVVSSVASSATTSVTTSATTSVTTSATTSATTSTQLQEQSMEEKALRLLFALKDKVSELILQNILLIEEKMYKYFSKKYPDDLVVLSEIDELIYSIIIPLQEEVYNVLFHMGFNKIRKISEETTGIEPFCLLNIIAKISLEVHLNLERELFNTGDIHIYLATVSANAKNKIDNINMLTMFATTGIDVENDVIEDLIEKQTKVFDYAFDLKSKGTVLNQKDYSIETVNKIFSKSPFSEKTN